MTDGFAQVIERIAAGSHTSTVVLDFRPAWGWPHEYQLPAGRRGPQAHFVLALPTTHAQATDERPADLAPFRDDSWVWLPRAISPDYHDEMVAACRQAGFSPPQHSRRRTPRHCHEHAARVSPQTGHWGNMTASQGFLAQPSGI
ncbi:hypothetical protein StoSoilB5_25120 [Arthrobacter sp. StoSoilB5]|nr:hypothetical protein StoSoilB5_25120 [Arthrobacter sp. StoSoilB5]